MRVTTSDGTSSLSFSNNCRGNRSGFVHESTCYTSYGKSASIKIQYYNRTWEPYTYCSAMSNALCSVIASLEYELIENFKKLNGYVKMTKKRRSEFELSVKDNKELQFYRAAYDKLYGSNGYSYEVSL